MDESFLNELKELKDAFLKETEKNSAEMARIGSLLTKTLEKASANASRPVPQATPSFYQQPPMNQPFYMMGPNGQIMPMMAFQPPPLQSYLPGNQFQGVPPQQAQTLPQFAPNSQGTQPTGEAAGTGQQGNLNAISSTSNTSTPPVVVENNNQ